MLETVFVMEAAENRSADDRRHAPPTAGRSVSARHEAVLPGEGILPRTESSTSFRGWDGPPALRRWLAGALTGDQGRCSGGAGRLAGRPGGGAQDSPVASTARRGETGEGRQGDQRQDASPPQQGAGLGASAEASQDEQDPGEVRGAALLPRGRNPRSHGARASSD